MDLTYTDPERGRRSWQAPLLGIAVSLALHAAVWRVWIAVQVEPTPAEVPPQVIEVALVAPQTKPEIAPPQVQQAPPQPPKPEPKPKKPAPKKPDKPKPTPKPAPKPEPTPAPAQETAAPPTAPAPVSAPPAPRQATTAAPFIEATYQSPSLNNPPTRYPRLALERHWEGTVTLRVQVLASGSAGEIKVERSSGHELLDESTVEQVKDWRFIPARKGAQAVDSWVIVPIEFKLKR